MHDRRVLNRLSVPFVLVFSFILLATLSSPCLSQDGDCSSAQMRWEQLFQELRDKIQDYSTIQQTSLERLTQRPIVDRTEGKTIARQISEAIQIKEEMLNGKRKECRSVLDLEERAFAELQRCAENGRRSKDKDVKNLMKKRQAFVEKAAIALSEVSEVEGKDTALPYVETMRDQDPYRQSVNNQWQNYMQMYRRGWGY
ncbi:MAG: hypothetical protein ACLP5H_09750 [Desulfomonilaceae bacterium]